MKHRPDLPDDAPPLDDADLLARAVEGIGPDAWKRKSGFPELRRHRKAKAEKAEASGEEYADVLARHAAEREAEKFRRHMEGVEVDAARLVKHKGDLEVPKAAVETAAERERRIKRGKIASQAEMDLHGKRLDEALEAVRIFVRESRIERLKVVKVITGKGLHSESGDSVVRSGVIGWLGGKGRLHVSDFYTPPARDGGSGALYIFLHPWDGEKDEANTNEGKDKA